MCLALALAGCVGADPTIAPGANDPPAAIPSVAPVSASGPAGTRSGALAGTAWEALALGGTAVTTAPAPTLTFDRAGRVSASGGCNSFAGSVRVGRGAIAFGEAFAGTRRACPGDLEARDQRMLAALQQAATYRTGAERLTLFDASGARVGLFVPAL
ncbi:MAG: META domain-containing protein [Pseudomonadota bacterium]